MNNLKEEREFLINEFSDEDKRSLVEISRIITKRSKRFDRKSAFLKKFTINMGKAYYNLYYKPRFVKKAKPEIKEIKIEVKKPEIKVEIKKNIPFVLDEAPKPIFEEPYIIIPEFNVKAFYKNGAYILDEPELNQNDKSILFNLKKKLGNKFYKERKIDENLLSKKLGKYSGKYKIKADEGYYKKIKYYFIRDVLGYGKIDALLKDKDVYEIICNGINQPILITYKDKYDIETNLAYDDERQLNEIIEKFSRALGKKLSEKEPFLSAKIDIGNIQANIKTKLSGAKFAIKKEVKNG